MAIIGVDRFETRAHNLHDFMLTAANQLCQRGSHALLVVSNQDTHTAMAETRTAGAKDTKKNEIR
jgi:hypothetical protein